MNYLDLIRASQTPIKRHLKLQSQANPFDSKYEEYFKKREQMKSKYKYKVTELLENDLRKA